MKKYEKPNKKHFKLKKYQKILIGILCAILLIATIILIVMFKDSIFTENVFILAFIAVFIVLVVIGLVVLWRLKQ